MLAFRNALSNARTEQENIATGRAWTNESYLRLAHVLIEDDVKTAFLQRHECLDRNGLDGRNSENRLPTFEEVCAARFNDPAYKPVTVEAPTLHSDFAESIELSFDRDIGTVSPDQVKTRLADTKTKLLLMINNWEASGNGDGNTNNEVDGDAEDEERPFGHFPEERMNYHDDNREKFLPRGHKSYLLYWWHLMDTEDILQSALSVLPEHTSATCDKVPTTAENSDTAERKKRKKNEEAEDVFLKRRVTSSFHTLSIAALQTNLSNAESALLDLQIRHATTDDVRVKAILEQAITRKQHEINSIVATLEAVV